MHMHTHTYTHTTHTHTYTPMHTHTRTYTKHTQVELVCTVSDLTKLDALAMPFIWHILAYGVALVRKSVCMCVYVSVPFI